MCLFGVMMRSRCGLVVRVTLGVLCGMLVSGSLPSARAVRKAMVFNNEFAVHVPAGKEAADAIASKHGFENIGQVRFQLKHKYTFLPLQIKNQKLLLKKGTRLNPYINCWEIQTLLLIKLTSPDFTTKLLPFVYC